MSQFDGRVELWESSREAIDAAFSDLEELASDLAQTSTIGRIGLIQTFMSEYAFAVDPDLPELGGGVFAISQRFNAEDMRKGLRHGNVGIVIQADSPVSDIVASVAASIGVAATLIRLFGQVSLFVVPDGDALIELAAGDLLLEPDCVFTFQARSDGSGFQHTITSAGNHLAGTTLDISYGPGTGLELRELQAAVRSIFDDVDEPDAIQATATGFEVVARQQQTVDSAVERITALVDARAESSGDRGEIAIRSTMNEFLPNRILARRIKTFADTLKMPQDRVRKQPYGPPVPWGDVSHHVATAIARYPTNGSSDSGAEHPNLNQAILIAKAVSGAGLDILGDMEFRGFAEGERIRALRERNIERTPRRWLGVHPVIPSNTSGPKDVRLPDVIVRGPGLPEPTLKDFIDDDDHS